MAVPKELPSWAKPNMEEVERILVGPTDAEIEHAVFGVSSMSGTIWLDVEDIIWDPRRQGPYKEVLAEVEEDPDAYNIDDPLIVDVRGDGKLVLNDGHHRVAKGTEEGVTRFSAELQIAKGLAEKYLASIEKQPSKITKILPSWAKPNMKEVERILRGPTDSEIEHAIFGVRSMHGTLWLDAEDIIWDPMRAGTLQEVLAEVEEDPDAYDTEEPLIVDLMEGGRLVLNDGHHQFVKGTEEGIDRFKAEIQISEGQARKYLLSIGRPAARA